MGGQTPAEVYQPSPRDFPERLPKSPEYPQCWQSREVRVGGQMSWQGEDIMISKVLGGQRVGLEPIDDGYWRLWFGTHELGVFDERKGQIRPPPKTPRPNPRTGTNAPDPEAPAR